MTGPEHYAAAEEILFLTRQADPNSPLELASLIRAQVHATLAQTAAAVLSDRDFRAWLDAAGPPRADP